MISPSPAATLLRETSTLLNQAINHHQKQTRHQTTLYFRCSTICLRSDGPLPLLLCVIISIVESMYFNFSYSSGTFTSSSSSSQPHQWISYSTANDRSMWSLLQTILLLFAVIINVGLHYRTETTEFSSRKKCVERFIHQLQQSSTQSQPQPQPQLSSSTNAQQPRDKHVPHTLPVWNLKASSISRLPTLFVLSNNFTVLPLFLNHQINSSNDDLFLFYRPIVILTQWFGTDKFSFKYRVHQSNNL